MLASKAAPLEFVEWFEAHSLSATHDLASSSVSPISLGELLNISESRGESEEKIGLNNIKLKEKDHPAGNVDFRRNLAALYSARSGGVTEDDIVVTNGAVPAHYTVFHSLLEPADHVICQHPVDELLYKLPASLGVEVTLWDADPAKKWQLDIEGLKLLIKDNTRMIVIQSPCDPTGAIVPKPTLEALVQVAEEKGILLLADETYRPLFHSILPSSDDFPPSTVNMGYRKAIVTGAISKAYSLAGVRAGWITCKDKAIINACKQTRRYTSMSASKLDEAVAAEAVSDRCIHALLGRNIRLTQTNLELLQGFIDSHSWACSWVKPLAGTTALIKFHKMGKPVDDEAFCLGLLEKEGVLISPASKCFGDKQKFRGHVRVAFGGSTSDLKAALEAWSRFMEEHYESVPTVSSK
ncbi:hypothetical protein HRR83_006934 [Exophiala dermatitidis]|uniref:Aminotransferase n=2 Tax=Exophiala dermatitidis TaxID=5970 RepID=H6BKD9_EXODN|nr:aminotransferase [Exophiala dermatitidis NIH/UT8656]KAJ4509745.1 hypothetical protein HRR75_005871 [Exophiala dermatitidis]EHY52573.1 aminotransferase [Exophiala dermatitidis NIH/UT8656]KAJ4512418.1 hypothetical protein HRR73_005973 [Exophiala dermatitidis]KAJ4512707.1 hypothetical protein HRR74_006405 [Exophiala dermatitidis]KAJ4542511.1 hypothetical protein HRR77_005709 [Exophiala dermatitidis]